MDFKTFANLHGLLVDSPHPSDRIKRCGTEANPRSKNGAYLYTGDRGWVQCWDGDCEVHWWDDMQSKTPTEEERQEWARRKAKREKEQEQLWGRAAVKAGKMMEAAVMSDHPYLHRKGFGDMQALVLKGADTLTPDSLFVPMYDMDSGELIGCQTITWDSDELKFVKKMMFGTRAQGAALRLGPAQTNEIILCEGYATGLSIDKAVRQMRLRAAVLVCFNDSNLVAIANKLKKQKGLRVYVFADNDPPQRDPEKAKKNPGMAGQRAAEKTGLNWCASPVEGEDANDLHVRAGLMPLCNLIMEARKPKSSFDLAAITT